VSEELRATMREMPNVTIIDLAGDVTSFADARLHSSFDTASARGLKYIILNFAGVEYINSAGIATVISILAEARQRAQQLVIVGLSEHYRKIFRMVGLTQYAEVYDTVDEAVRELKNRTTVEPA
jgi:anti-anti-sigma factor